MPPPAGDVPPPMRGHLPCRALPQRVLRSRHSTPPLAAPTSHLSTPGSASRHQPISCVSSRAPAYQSQERRLNSRAPDMPLLSMALDRGSPTDALSQDLLSATAGVRAGAVRMPAPEGEAALQLGQAAAAPEGPARGDRRQQRRAAPGLRLQVQPAQGAHGLPTKQLLWRQ